jgi:hypothetical protein
MDLWALRHFFVGEARAIAADEKTADALAAVQFFEGWGWQGPGVYVGADFDPFVSVSSARASCLLRIFERAKRRIAGFGSAIPLEYLQAHVNSSTAYFTVQQPVERFCHDIDRLIALLKKTPNQSLQPTAASRRG